MQSNLYTGRATSFFKIDIYIFVEMTILQVINVILHYTNIISITIHRIRYRCVYSIFKYLNIFKIVKT